MVTGSGLAYEDGGAMANGQVAIISSMTILEIIDLIFFAVSIKSSQRTATIPRYIYIYIHGSNPNTASGDQASQKLQTYVRSKTLVVRVKTLAMRA